MLFQRGPGGMCNGAPSRARRPVPTVAHKRRAVNPAPQGWVVLLVHEDAGRRLGTRDRLFRNGYTVLVAGTLTGTRNLLADLMPVSAVVDMGGNVDRAVELQAQVEQDPRFSGVPIMLQLELE